MIQALTRLFRRKSPTSLPQFKPVLNSSVPPEVRQRLRDWLNSSETKLAFSILESTRPTAFVGIRVNTHPEINLQAAAQRLHQIQGWEAARNTLLTLDKTPQEIKDLQETYSNES